MFSLRKRPAAPTKHPPPTTITKTPQAHALSLPLAPGAATQAAPKRGAKLLMVMKKNEDAPIQAQTHYIRLTNENLKGQIKCFWFHSLQFCRILKNLTIAMIA